MDKKENQPSMASISNFFTSNSTNDNISQPHSLTSQAFPPIENIPQQYLQQSQINLNNEPIPQTQKSFLEKVNSTASEVIDYIKNKAPALPSNINIISKKLLDNVDPLTIISEIKMENFEKNIFNKSIKEVECLKLEKTQLNDITILVNISNPHQINNY